MADKAVIIRLLTNTESFKRGMNQAVGHMNMFRRGLGQLKSMMLTTFSVYAIGSLIRNSINTFKEFEQAMADVRSITNATQKDFEALKNSAKHLGETTKFTNAEVAGLQKELAKLGFTTKEILAATDSVLMLAAAMREDLGNAATVTGVTLRQFDLDASEMQRVVDVMAKSFSSSLLDMHKFSESMKYVGTIAKITNVSIEEATALLMALANAGIDGSMAGTALRMIMLEVGKEGGTLAEKLEILSKKGLSLAEANTEVGQRAMTALLVLKEQLPVVKEFVKDLNDVDGVARRMADIQLDTLTGRLTILKSAWSGLNTEIWDGGDAITGYEKGIKGLTWAFNDLTLGIRENRTERKKYEDQRLEYWVNKRKAIEQETGYGTGKPGGREIWELWEPAVSPEEEAAAAEAKTAKIAEQIRLAKEAAKNAEAETARRAKAAEAAAKAQAAAIAAFKEETELRRIIFGYPGDEIKYKPPHDPFGGGIGEFEPEIFNEEDIQLWKQNMEGIQNIVAGLEGAFASFFSNTQGGLKAMVESFKSALAQMAVQLAAKAAVFTLLSILSGGTGAIAGIAKGLIGGQKIGDYMGFGKQKMAVSGVISGKDIHLSNSRYQSGLNGNS